MAIDQGAAYMQHIAAINSMSQHSGASSSLASAGASGSGMTNNIVGDHSNPIPYLGNMSVDGAFGHEGMTPIPASEGFLNSNLADIFSQNMSPAGIDYSQAFAAQHLGIGNVAADKALSVFAEGGSLNVPSGMGVGFAKGGGGAAGGGAAH